MIRHIPGLFFSEADEKERVSAFDKEQGQHAEFNYSLKKSATPAWNAVLIKVFQGLNIDWMDV